jgi:hypothetical protein
MITIYNKFFESFPLFRIRPVLLQHNALKTRATTVAKLRDAERNRVEQRREKTREKEEERKNPKKKEIQVR